jgi:glyceraldehyde-3-phosphate dehydrogenase (NADP+)
LPFLINGERLFSILLIFDKNLDMENYPLYLAGNFIDTSKQISVVNPFDESIVAKVSVGGKEEINLAIEKAETVKEELSLLPSYKRYEILKFLSEKLKENQKYYAEILSAESGKPMRYAMGEIARASQTFLVAAEESKRLPKEYINLDWTIPGENKEGLVKYFPVGTVAGITPFNFPMNLAVHKIAPAIAAGCPIIIKPASKTPLSVLELAKLIDQTELPKGAFSAIPANREAGDMLVTDERIKLLSFTGSPAVGWEMKSRAGKKKVVLELGGNAGVIVSDSAPLEKAVDRCLVGGFAYSGQVCIHTQRIYVHEKVYEEFTSKFIQKIKNLKAGNPLDENTEVSVVIDKQNADRISDWIKEAVDMGATLLYGGKKKGNFVQPTVLSDTNKKMKVNCMEVFGPVVVLEKINSFKQGILEINNSEFGLQAGVFTGSIEEMNMAFNHLEVGGVIINDVPTFRVDHMPYGGVKNSGLGREGVKYAILDMMEPRILVKDIL